MFFHPCPNIVAAAMPFDFGRTLTALWSAAGKFAYLENLPRMLNEFFHSDR
jgi:hypothetical protein